MLSAKAPRERRHPLVALRPLALLTTAAALAGAGCGDSGGTTTAEPPASGDTTITVTLDADGAQGKHPVQTKKLSCIDGPAREACVAANDIATADLAPVSPDVACTEIFGGPDETTIKGTLEGEGVDATLTRANGCEIARFDAAAPLLRALFPGYEPGEALKGPAPG